MSGLSPKFPLTYSGADGHYSLNKAYSSMIQQNLKNLVLTSPGERLMDSDFGVGLYNFLFELDSVDLRDELTTRISQQVTRYMPFVNIENIEVHSPSEEPLYEQTQSNFLSVIINYEIPSLDIDEVLKISVLDFWYKLFI